MNISGLPSGFSSYATPAAARPVVAGAGEKSAEGSGKSASTGQQGAPEQAEIRELKARDQEVRQHEQAHLSAAGGLAVSAASFTYQKGPDGVNYAVGGEVSIDTSAGKTPEETLQRARTIRAAALAPADPSGQDQAVAAQAGQMEQQANAELAQQRTAQAASSETTASGAGRSPDVAGYYAGVTNDQRAAALSIYA
jgi:hypothetical protein